MAELPDVPSLRTLEPPPGGLEQLRERLVVTPRRRWILLVPAVALAALMVWLALPHSQAPRVEAIPETALRDHDMASDGTFYWVASTPGRPVRATASPVVSIDEVQIVHDYAPP